MKGNNIAYIGIGSNLGDRWENIQTATDETSNFCTILSKSSIYETDPVELKNQPKFLNTVIKIETNLSSKELLIKLHEIEHKLGRNRAIEAKNGPRAIDIDILFYNDEIVKSTDLEIPHPRLHERNFVLTPLREIAENMEHPVFNKNIKTLLKNLKNPEKITLWI